MFYTFVLHQSLMKRILLFLFILISISWAKASDTLTLRQIYNFNVGDTFDYANISIIYNEPIYVPPTYNRYVITGKTLFSDSVIYVEQQVYPTSQIDTLKYGGLTNSILYIDTTGIGLEQIDSFNIGISNWDSIYNLDYSLEFEGSWAKKYETGLGITYNDHQGWGDVEYNGYQLLIYYSKGNTHAGTPYYNYTTGINNIPNLPNIHLYPNPTTDQLHLSFTGAGALNAQFIMTDILGQEVYSSPVIQSETTHDISKLSTGIYSWKVVSNNSIVKTGKVVKE